MGLFEPRSATFRANPYPAYRQLREQAPVYFDSNYNSWLISRYDDINRLLRDERLGYTNVDDWSPDTTQWQDSRPDHRHLAMTEAESKRLSKSWVIIKSRPRHTYLHKLFHQALSVAEKQLAPRIEALADTLLDQVQPLDRFDLVTDYALPLASTIITEMLGIPEKDRAMLLKWAYTVAIAIDVDTEPIMQTRRHLAFVGMTQYFRKLIANKQDTSEPDGFINLLMQAYLDGQLTIDEFLANYSLLLMAGYSTTANGIGNGMLALLRHPTQWQRLQAQPSLIKTTVSECLRYDAPAQAVARTLLEDVECGDKVLPAGQHVLLLLGAGNRDPEQFYEPDSLDIGRHPNHYLAFGRGIHHCLGARLALLVNQIAISKLAHRLPDLTLSDEPLEWEKTYIMHALKSFPVLKGSR